MFEHYLEKINQARVYDLAKNTPLDAMARLSTRLGNRLLLKREDLQPVFSFKLRGAYNRMQCLTEQERQQGVISASAGNHAQGVALSARKMGLSALIVMPTTTPKIKVESVANLGADIALHGDNYDEACQYALQLAQSSGRTFIHPYDDPDVIAGQGTIAKEIVEQHQDKLDAIFVPVGGGGLIAGVSAYIKAMRPETKIIAVESEDAACLNLALESGQRMALDQVGLFADGTAVKQIGAEPFKVVRHTIDEVMTVNSDEICAAIMDIFEDTRSIAEPSGALAVAGVKKYIARYAVQDQTFVLINSGANINFDRLRHVAERAELGEGRETLFAATIDETPGSFQTFCQLLGHYAITEFNYRYDDNQRAQVFVGVKLDNDNTQQQLFERLNEADYQWTNFSDNEMAKLHVRHMVGGHAPQVQDEKLYRFEFPERPGALLRFLTRMGQRWNISLFHYRNHGAAYGRVLVGVQVSDKEFNEFQGFLDALDYHYWAETENPAYELFLR